MKKIIVSSVMFLTVCAGFAFSQTQQKIVRRTTKRPIIKKTIVKRKTIGKKSVSGNSNAVTTRSGLTYIITKIGTGAPLKAGDNIIVNYTGLLTNGRKFDSSLDRRKPFSFPLGAGYVIKGWDEGFGKLKVGDHATLIIPPSIGYGASGAGGVIPPNATLIFIVEVLGVQ